MKFSKVGQVSLVSATALILATAFSACNPVTIDYLFVAGDNGTTAAAPVDGQIQVFRLDRVSGAADISGKPVSSGGIKPVSEATSTDYKYLYVANQGDSTIVQFSIGGSGQLTSVKTTTMSAEGNTPVAITISADGSLLYVANMYQPGCSAASTKQCGGALAVFPIGSDGSLGTAVANGGLSYVPVGINPTAVSSLADGTAAYVTTYDPTAGIGYVYGFGATTGGALTSLQNSPYQAGVRPAGIVCDLVNRFVYITDFSQNQLIGYQINDGGVLHPLVNGPFKTGNQPSGITIDPRSKFLYITNELDNTVSAYAIDTGTGTPAVAVNTSGSTSNPTGTQPVAILVDPSYGRYVYTANYLDNSVTAFGLNPLTGTITVVANGPFPTGIGQPIALASVPRGNHPVQIVQQ